MKMFFYVLGILFFSSIVGLGFIACGDGGGDGGGDTSKPATPATPQPFRDITAAELVSEIKVGWNLGNTLEAYDNGEGWLPPSSTVQAMETAWSNPVTTKSNITAIKNAGFNAIRIPVTWTKAATGAPNYAIRADWMARVVEVVNYAVANDMYILLNTHHDEEHVYGFMNSDAAAGKAAYGKIWEQIAATFKNYNEKLIFEGMNEPRTKGSANEWSGGTAEERSNLNAYYQIFVDKVRASGGNNDKRILQINTYGSYWGQTGVDGLVLPNDPKPNKLIVAFHMYEPFTFCYNQTGSVTTWNANTPADTATINQAMDRFYNKYIQNGIPVIIGECGTQNKDNTSAREAWTEYYFKYAWSKGIKCFLFDNGLTAAGGSSQAEEAFGIFNRKTNSFDYPGILSALLNGTKGTQGGIILPANELVIDNPSLTDVWTTNGTLTPDASGYFSLTTSDGDLLAYTFPTGWNNFSKIEISYTTEIISQSGEANKIAVKRLKSGAMYDFVAGSNYGELTSGNSYPWVDGSGIMSGESYNVKQFDGCIGFQFAAEKGNTYKIKFTKIRFHN